jgi:glycosyltransferase involved in cell wall biosynthesis
VNNDCFRTQDRFVSFLFLSVQNRWVYALAESLAQEHVAHTVKLYDWRTYLKHRPSWPDPDPEADLERTLRVLPPGFSGRLEWLSRPFMRTMVDRWRKNLREQSGTEPYVVVPYPYLAPWVRNVPDERLIYYNLDAYTQYQPSRAAQIREKEAELVERAGLTVCLAQRQVETLRERHPSHASRIQHFPLGVLETFLNPDPTSCRETSGVVGYVGNLSDRVDWHFVREVAERCTDLHFRFAGGIEAVGMGNRPEWQQMREKVFELPNVEHVGRIPQEQVTEVYWNSTVNWIPYDPDHPFNEASCPTKIMDAIASGRPVVSTAVPECTLYPQWIEIAESAKEAAAILQNRVERPDAHAPDEQVQFAKQHTWDHRADTFQHLLRQKTEPESVSHSTD